jgi:hypothetical protein
VPGSIPGPATDATIDAGEPVLILVS